MILLGLQLALIISLVATIVLICFVDTNERLQLYLFVVASLLIALLGALAFNLVGKYIISAWMTTFITAIGPWCSIFLDVSVGQGDFVPLVYLALSIQLCAILLSELATLMIGIMQLSTLVLFIFCSPALMKQNWPSLVAFVVIASTIAIISSVSNRKQLEQIEKHRNQLQNNEALLRELAQRDALTGIYNRRYMEETLEREICRATRKGQGLGIIMADVNHFKVINDTYGHALGDAVLRHVAQILGAHTRGSDVVCRYGGDEFVLILPECTFEQSKAKAQALCEVMANAAFQHESGDIERVSLSFGVAALPDHGTKGDDILKAADKAMYESKNRERYSGVSLCQCSMPQ